MSFDTQRAESAVRAFLEAAGLDPDSPELSQTPRLVAQAWREDLLDGYDADITDILADRYPAGDSGMVTLAGIDFHAMCPHHLLPYEGVIHLAYLPAREVVGLSRLVRLVDACAHRLVLQEHLANTLADALVTHLNARGAGVILRARQGCMIMRGVKRDVDVVSHAWRGAFETDESLRAELFRSVGLSEPS